MPKRKAKQMLGFFAFYTAGFLLRAILRLRNFRLSPTKKSPLSQQNR
jgi:hypothetical protein